MNIIEYTNSCSYANYFENFEQKYLKNILSNTSQNNERF